MNQQTPIPPSERWQPLVQNRPSTEAQERRLAQLTWLRLQRPLTLAERAEQERLEFKKYHREFQRERKRKRLLQAAAKAARS